jgi:ABC-type branched-subunit amino acid transport system substrate-binding protein
VTRPCSQRALLTTSVAIVLALVLAACGSNLDPNEVRAGSGGTTVQNGVAVDGSAASEGDTGLDDSGLGLGDTSGGDTSGGGDTGGSVDTGGGSDTGGADTGGGDTGGGDTGDSGGGDTGGDTGDSGGGSGAAGSCDGFKNGPGITDSTITIGNSSDISGPVPGLFETAQDAMKAYVTYYNKANPDGICGRSLVLKTYDSRTDAAADQQAYAAGCTDVFAMVGSVSAFDLGGAKTAQSCGLPDLRGGSVTFERNACTTCFGVQAVNTNFFENAVPDFVKQQVGSASAQKAAYFYTNAGAAAQNAKAQVSAMEKRGLKFPVVQGIDIAEFNYSTYVQQMKDNDIDVVFFTSDSTYSVRLRQAMAQQGYKPKLYLRDPTDYNPTFVQQGGSAVEGTTVFTNFVPFEEAANNPEMATYVGSLKQVKPSANPLFFGVFSWSAGRLFTDLATKLGGKLSRASLLAEVKKVNDWTGNGMHAPQPVGSKGTGECWRFIQLTGGQWKPVGGTKYACNGLSSSK